MAESLKFFKNGILLDLPLADFVIPVPRRLSFHMIAIIPTA